jgi:ubiquinone/menaquinone biosynthesis C-methylase UbiE
MSDRYDIEEEVLTLGKNTYFIDTTDMSINSAEFVRLLKQDTLMNVEMKEQIDVFPDGYVPTEESAILDVACGPGGWLRDVALDYPNITLKGIDNNKKVIDFARNHEQTSHNQNVSFELMNILDPFDFADETFDFINIRFVTGVLSTNEEEWLTLMKECHRLLRPGGYLRITESEMSWIAHAPVTNRFLYALMQVMWTAGKSFSSWQLAITPMIEEFFGVCQFTDIKQTLLGIDYSYGMKAHNAVIEDTLMIMKISRKPLISIGGIPGDEFDPLFKQMAQETKGERFRATWPIVITDGRKAL